MSEAMGSSMNSGTAISSSGAAGTATESFKPQLSSAQTRYYPLPRSQLCNLEHCSMSHFILGPLGPPLSQACTCYSLAVVKTLWVFFDTRLASAKRPESWQPSHRYYWLQVLLFTSIKADSLSQAKKALYCSVGCQPSLFAHIQYPGCFRPQA